MTFGMMVPDWMIDGAYVVPQGPVWHTHKYDAATIDYVATTFNSKASPDGEKPQNIGIFASLFDRRNYQCSLTTGNFSYYSDANGAGYVMHAPSPAGMVVNEYYDWAVADFIGLVSNSNQTSRLFFLRLAPPPGMSPTFRDYGTSVFSLPASPPCTPSNVSSVEAIRWVRKHYPGLYAGVQAAIPRELWHQI